MAEEFEQIPSLLYSMRRVSCGVLDDPPGEEQLRCVAWRDHDPVGFMRELLAAEKLFAARSGPSVDQPVVVSGPLEADDGEKRLDELTRDLLEGEEE